MQAHPPEEDAADLGRTGDRVERLLADIRAQATPPVWRHVDELVHRLLELYGAGLGRLTDLALQSGATREQLASDQLVSSLLLLHGLHPLPADQRIRRALARITPVFEAQALTVELAGLDAEGRARVQVTGANDGRNRPLGAIRTSIHQAVEEAAPEVVHVEIDGLPSAEPAGLVQLHARPVSVEATT